MFSKREVQEIYQYINDNPEANIYLGCDSQRMKRKRVKFATVLIVHGKNGKSRIFKDILFDKVVDAKLSRPFNRMLKEVILVTELYTLLEDVLIERDFEIHLDISEDKQKGSSVAAGAAKGMIFGIVGVEPVMKPFSWASSTVADKFSK